MAPTTKERWQAGLQAAGLAAVTNAAIYAAAKSADVSFEVTNGVVSAGQVVTSSIFPILLGTALAVAARSHLRWILGAAVVVTLLSLGGPFSMASDTATKFTLALMHVVAGASFVVFHQRRTALVPAT